MSEYFNILEKLKKEQRDKIVKNWGSLGKYNEFIKKCKSNENEIAKVAIKQYGSIEKYAEAIRKNFNSDILTISEQYNEFKKACLEDKHPKLKELYKKLVSDLTKDFSSKEIQKIAEEISCIAKKDYELFKRDNGDDYWYYMIQNYLLNPDWIKKFDNKYGNGACKFIGKALKNYLGDKQPKINTLYKNLTYDLSKDPSSKDVQQIIKEISDITKKHHDFLKVDMGDNYLGFMADLYLSKPEFIKIVDKKYGSGASKFIGTALKFYCENN